MTFVSFASKFGFALTVLASMLHNFYTQEKEKPYTMIYVAVLTNYYGFGTWKCDTKE